ncbi:MAG: rhomboid family intramembrane serine protease [Acidobacteria bacterium]|nr:rhomboid family intramembrane serine protease [Acidobacteriota bacterium]
MIPLKDDIPARSAPIVTVGLIVVNLAASIYTLLLAPELREEFIYGMAVIPLEIVHLDPFTIDQALYNGMTLFTSMFLHGGPLHLISNMLYLWIFGNNVEDTMGHGRFVLFYLLCGLCATVAQIAAGPDSTTPMIGASGAIAGVLGAYIVLFPTARVLTLLILVVIVRIVRIPALILLGIWLLIQLIQAGGLESSGVAWFAHIGGFAAGLALIVPFRRRKPRHRLF